VAALMPVRRLYLDTAAGQLHLTEAGIPGAPPLVLLPWYPRSARMYAAEMPVLAERLHVLAIDPMGLGRSGPRPPGWTAQDHAAPIAHALAMLGISAPHVLAGHFGASIALALLDLLPVPALILDGPPLLPPDAVEAIRARIGPPPSPLDPLALWQRAIGAYAIFDPAFRVSEATLPLLHAFIADWLDAGAAPADMPPLDDAAARLAGYRGRALFLTAETDPLRPAFAPARAALPGAAGHVFPGGNPLHDPARAGDYARAVLAFLG
jgi:pimeloyl-ACP methyl ester carboxylesterase